MPAHAITQARLIDFALWALDQHRPITARDVEGYFNVSRQSAWRLHRIWLRAVSEHSARRLTPPTATGDH